MRRRRAVDKELIFSAFKNIAMRKRSQPREISCAITCGRGRSRRPFCCLRFNQRACRRAGSGDLIRKSSSFFPDLSCAVSQRGCFPRPAQVSDGRLGFLNFGTTLAYGRRARLMCSSLVNKSWPSCRNRCSSRPFSANILPAKTESICS